ncbi:16S rRNA (uracil(1498)-N(3))-methyltransferase [Blastochloris viridis]|uniref:Ribosomal RNA small subunit methyltransferase E n=1 Tax=Blastochloris viridis TaxID=1079 RepID=A0A0H5B7L2_BLAVI|nr:16S rRNA (uracil(1498)-N(3))-methyltransferase [Blastochloris viridis]ALK08550.1 Ribosomal RNA small subunit methyltransferase E [Blastochloris viridis]BAR98162.1 ribosomal RNA small subunit methyltransferase E [Blastochloris viridis]CUU41213.1 Ribosomal RNA small subunit methyltransferase E [Blastochloris viridis]
MAAYDFSSVRLFVDAALAPGAEFPLGLEPTNYLANVLRLRAGDELLVFNGRDGEWRARISDLKKRAATLELVEQTRPQTAPCDLWYLFAPLKHARLDYMVQKAVEMGAAVLQPVMTRRTQVSRINLDRMRANAIEAAEQCGILDLAEVRAEVGLEALLATWPAGRTLVFCDEDAAAGGAAAALGAAAEGPLAVLIGPEGGFDPAERARLMTVPKVVRLSLGPRILRADTAAVAALALVQAVRGDWR